MKEGCEKSVWEQWGVWNRLGEPAAETPSGRNGGLRANDAKGQQGTEVASPGFRAAVGNGKKRKECSGGNFEDTGKAKTGKFAGGTGEYSGEGYLVRVPAEVTQAKR